AGVDISLIQKSFKCCGISVARNRSEDNLISDSNNDSYRDGNSKDSNNSDSDSNNINSDNINSDDINSDEFDINKYEEKEVSDYENEY
ncbi:5996_t:CDS:2, partial [Funneliformis caledonium]